MSKRLLKEIKQYNEEKCDDIILSCVNDDDIFHWDGLILGPPDTPYENAFFHLDIAVPTNYPFQPPVIKFRTRIFHPNVHFKVCVRELLVSII